MKKNGAFKLFRTILKKTFVIPQKPLSWNSMYRGMHWTKRKKIVDQWHKDIRFECFNNKVPHFISAHITIVSRAKRPLDTDNICSKLIIDGLVKAGVLDDDTNKYVKSLHLVSEKSEKDETEISLRG